MQLATFPCLPYSSTKVLFVSFFVLCLFNWATVLDEGKKETRRLSYFALFCIKTIHVGCYLVATYFLPSGNLYKPHISKRIDERLPVATCFLLLTDKYIHTHICTHTHTHIVLTALFLTPSGNLCIFT